MIQTQFVCQKRHIAYCQLCGKLLCLCRSVFRVPEKRIPGRHHQIRVQMANAGLSLLGDRKYADAQAVRLSEQLGMKDIALCAGRLAFMHPATGKKMIFSVMPEGKSFQEFRQEIEADRNKDSRRSAVSDEIMPCHCAQR